MLGDQFALIVGHDDLDKGAVNYLGEKEFDFNSRIAYKVRAMLDLEGFCIDVIRKPSGLNYPDECEATGKRLQELGIIYAIELHFNSADQVAHGCEAFISGSQESKDIACLLVSGLEGKGFKQRGIKIDPARGRLMLEEFRKVNVSGVLFEPCFGNQKTNESTFIFEHEDAYCEILASSIKRFLSMIKDDFSRKVSSSDL